MKLGLPITLVSIAALGGALYLTNPTEEDYAQYLSQTLSTDAQVSLCQPEGLSEWLGRVGEAISNACESAIAGGQSLSAQETQALIVENTEYSNRIFFSTYITQTPLGDYRAIGALNRFWLRDAGS
jgi:hypothetical protein